MIKHLYLDLEDTVITPVNDGWFNTHMINVEKLKSFIAKYQPDYIHLFSFAIWNQEEKKRFVLGTQPMIEQALGIDLVHIPTVDDDILPRCCNEMHLGPESVDFMELCNFWGKQGAFRLYIQHVYKQAEGRAELDVTLLDDVVFNEHFSWPDKKITGHILNIDELEES